MGRTKNSVGGALALSFSRNADTFGMRLASVGVRFVVAAAHRGVLHRARFGDRGADTRLVGGAAGRFDGVEAEEPGRAARARHAAAVVPLFAGCLV